MPMYLEMSRDPIHGGKGWDFPNCLWAPTKKKLSGARWPFWTRVRNVRVGDIVLHLRGVQPKAAFVGYSQAASDGFETIERPPEPGEWGYAESFFRAELENYVPFHKPIGLPDVFTSKKRELEGYLEENRGKALGVFFVKQSNRLQCLNGAYLSEVSEELLSVLFDGFHLSNQKKKATTSVITVETGTQISLLRTRLGHKAFADGVKNMYGNRCCFPCCSVNDPRFLIGSHIARWSDNENLRGHFGNGLCFCLMHDKAFELGLFTLDEKFRVVLNSKRAQDLIVKVCNLKTQNGKRIRLASVLPLEDALQEHRCRVGVSRTQAGDS